MKLISVLIVNIKNWDIKCYDDNIDGDLTKKVKITEKENEVIYEVEGKAHNKTSVTRKIQVGDKRKPTIELTGGDIVFSYIGEAYVEPGYKATDNCRW